MRPFYDMRYMFMPLRENSLTGQIFELYGYRCKDAMRNNLDLLRKDYYV